MNKLYLGDNNRGAFLWIMGINILVNLLQQKWLKN